MFKTPEWADDVPKTHTSFMKKNGKKEKASPKIATKVSLKVNEIKNNKSTKVVTPIIKKITPKMKKIKENTSLQSKFSSRVNKRKSIDSKAKFSPKVNHIKEKKRKLEKKTKSPKINNVVAKNKTLSTNTDNTKSRKRKLDKKSSSIESEQNLDQIGESQNFDEVLLNAKKKKFNEVIENDDQEDLLFSEAKQTSKKNKKDTVNNNNTVILNNNSSSKGTSESSTSKKMKLRAILDSQSYRRHINVDNKGNKLRERMLERLKAAQFRYLNEKLYTSSGSEAQQLFQNDPAAFETYHQGYQLQVKKWPVNPLDVIVKKIMKMPKTHLIADMGCGEAALSKRIPHKIRSFDLVATAPGVETCDMARTPLLTASMDATVYCLALMGTDLTQYLVEANRVLKMGGHLLIAEVESRFDNVENFTKEVQRLGFKLKQLDKNNDVFFFMEFTKIRDPPVKKGKLPAITLKPCIYKRR